MVPEDKPSEQPPVSWSCSRSFRTACLGGAGILLVVYLVSVGTRYLLNDDYQALYTAWLKSQGKVAGRDYFLASYQLLMDLMVPLFRVGRESWFPLYFMRCLFVAVLGWTLLLLARISRRLFDGATGWALPVVLLATTTMLHRGLDLRPDLITNLLWVAILVQLLSGQALARKSVLAVGALFALVILSRFKGLLIAPLILCSYLYLLRGLDPGAWFRKLGRMVLLFALGMFIVFLPYLAWIAATDGLGEFFRVNHALFADIGNGDAGQAGVMGQTFAASLRLDYLFWSLAIGGLSLRARRWKDFSTGINLMLAGILVTALGTVVLNPAYYAYNLTTVQTLLAPFAAYGLVQLAGKIHRSMKNKRVAPFLAGAVMLTPILWNWEAVGEVIQDSNRHQKDLQRFILEYLRPDQAVFGLEGMGLFRPSAFHWRFPAILAPRYQRGGWSYAKELEAVKPELIIISYRIPGWLTAPDLDYIASRYVRLTPLLLVPGFDSTGKGDKCAFEVQLAGPYEVFLAGPGTCSLDGTPVRAGDVRMLSEGSHPLQLDRTRCLLRRHYPPEALALVKNPEGLPYLDPPGLTLPTSIVVPSQAR